MKLPDKTTFRHSYFSLRLLYACCWSHTQVIKLNLLVIDLRVVSHVVYGSCDSYSSLQSSNGWRSWQVHRVSVRTVTSRGQSKDQQCTLLIGKGKLGLRVSNIGNCSHFSLPLFWITPNYSVNFRVAVFLNTKTIKRLKLTWIDIYLVSFCLYVKKQKVKNVTRNVCGLPISLHNVRSTCCFSQ